MANATVSAKPEAGTKKVKIPVSKSKFGPIEVACWDNEATRKDGTSFSAFNLTVRYSYKDKDGQWQESKMSIPRKQVFNMICALENAYELSNNLSDATVIDDVTKAVVVWAFS